MDGWGNDSWVSWGCDTGGGSLVSWGCDTGGGSLVSWGCGTGGGLVFGGLASIYVYMCVLINYMYIYRLCMYTMYMY